MEIATIIRRSVRDTTQRRIAARMGCSPATMSRLLRGVDQFAALLAALDLEIEQ